jgi:hypothetical protein
VIETFIEVAVSPEDDAEIRRIAITNHSRSIREVELTSYAEVVLAPHAADLAHPAFSNLFIESSAVPENDAIICARRPRAHEGRLYMAHVLAGRPRLGDPIEFETDREHFIGRGGSMRTPAALAGTEPLSGATGAVLDPIVSIRTRLRVPPGVTARVSFTTVVAENEDGVRALIEKYHDPQVCARHSRSPARTARSSFAISASAAKTGRAFSGWPAVSSMPTRVFVRPKRSPATRARLRICGSTASPATCPSCWSRLATHLISPWHRSSSGRRST